MESAVPGSQQEVVLEALKSLLNTLTDNWGVPGRFRKNAGQTLWKRKTSAMGGQEEFQVLAEQVYRLVEQILTLHIRPIYTLEALEKINEKLAPLHTGALHEGCLWLAVEMRRKALEYLELPAADRNYSNLIESLDERRATISRGFMDIPDLTLDSLEYRLVTVTRGAAIKREERFHTLAVAGALLEKARRYARLHPSEKEVPADFSGTTPESRVISALEEPARHAELNEAKQRFSSLENTAKSERYNALRDKMQKNIEKVVAHAAEGFETFCETVESIAFPYPGALEWVRAFLRPLYDNARQSTTFDKCNTELHVQQRYEQLQEERGVNPLMVELSRAFALSTLESVQESSIKDFVYEVDFVNEFGWPADLDDLKKNMSR